VVADLFERNHVLRQPRGRSRGREARDGKYEVTLALHAEKRYADGKGVETPGKLDDEIEIGVFARGKSGKEEDEKRCSSRSAVSPRPSRSSRWWWTRSRT
jgi:hypothetical protein